MNPYLEQDDAWHDFHDHFCVHCRMLLVPKLSPDYFAKLEEHLDIHELGSDERRPVVGRLEQNIDIERESYIEIRDRKTRRLVTVVELLSPSNKRPGADREQYLSKRWQLVSSEVHLVEIDLLRGWPRMPVRDLPPCDYYVMVSRSEQRPDVQLWPIRLRDPLPEIPIPLSGPDEAVVLDLQLALQNSYDSAGYADYIYDGQPDPPLSAADSRWVDEILQQSARDD
jgi:hypothetical protein